MADILSDISQDPDITLHISGNYIGSAYSPQVEVTDTNTGHDVAITYDDAEDGIKTKTFSVEDGVDYVLTQEDRTTIADIVEDDLNTYIDAMERATASANQQEQSRATAESGRVSAEQARQSAETARNSAEGTRTQAESQRAESERQRAAAEQSRATTETSRATAETQRNSAEQARQTAEGARVTAEQGRATAEQGRVSAETARATEWAEIESDAQSTIDAAQDATQDATAAAAEARAASAATWLSGNVLFGELAEAAVLTTDDAYSAPPKFLSVYGKSTQDGTPTPSVPVPILSVDALTLHASADGTTDYTNWPVQIPLSNNVGRSLPDGTRDELTLSYIGPAQTEGWGVFSKTLVQRVDNSGVISSGANYVQRNLADTCTNVQITLSEHNWPSGGSVLSTQYKETVLGWRYLDAGEIRLTGSGVFIGVYATFANSAAANAWLAEHPFTFDYPLATPVTHDLGTVELPVNPAPDLTAWADGGSAQPTVSMGYERALSVVIPRIEAQLADMATS